jgi:hypothetical protein
MNTPRSESSSTDDAVVTARSRRGVRVIFGLTLAVFLLIVLDVAVGLTMLRGGRFLEWPVPPYSLLFSQKARDRLYKPPTGSTRFDADLGWSLEPGYIYPEDEGAGMVNRGGFHAARDYELDAPAGVTRIGAFGDSYTYSGGDYFHTWTHVLEGSRPNLEVLNFGVGGYGTDQAYLRYRRDGVAYKPDIVLIGLMLENALRNVSVYRPAYYHDSFTGFKPRFLIDDSEALSVAPCPVSSLESLWKTVQTGSALPVLRESDFWVRRAPLAYEDSPLFWSSFARILYAGYENSGRWQGSYYQDTGSEPFRVTAAILRDFYAEALQDGADRALVLLFPDLKTIEKRMEGEAPYWHTLTDYLDARDIPYVDLTPHLLAASQGQSADFLFRGNHYNNEGNAMIAQVVADRLFPRASP